MYCLLFSFPNVQSGAVRGGKLSGSAQQISTSLTLGEAGHSDHGGEAAQCQNSMQKKSGTFSVCTYSSDNCIYGNMLQSNRNILV